MIDQPRPADPGNPSAPQDAAPAVPAADRNLLFGILALQLDFIGRDTLIAAMHAWILDKRKTLGQILVARQALQPDKYQLLEALVQAHLEQHGDRVENSLAALSSATPLRRDLEKVNDPDVQASLLLLTDDPPPPAELRTTDFVFAAPGVTLRYEILRPHARGGLGAVYVARDPQLGREVALKEIQAEHAGHPGHRSRFLREAEITGRLEHPGVVPVYGLGQYADGRPFYAMRFIKGDSLKDAIRAFHGTDGERGKAPESPAARNLAFRQLLGRFVDVCNAVAYAHSRGVLHRDLKPGNIMLGKYGETLIVDWGLARALDQPEDESTTSRPALESDPAAGLTRAGSVLGTPGYMSPEQAAGRLDELGPASDVYSLGATLYTLLTGRPPFASGDTGSILQKVQKGDFARPRQVRRAVPPALEAVCLKAMALRPDDRYASPKRLAEDIEHWLADEPVSAWREPLPVRARRWMKRNRVLVMACGTALLVGALSLGVATVLLSAKNDELRRANAGEAAAYRQAQANFEMASQAVEDYMFNVADDDRLKERDLSELRKKLVASATTFYQKFIAARREDPRLEFMLGRAYYNLGYLHAELSESKEAVEKLLQAQAILQRLCDADPDNPEYRYYLASAGLDLEAVYRHDQKRLDEAEKQWHQAAPLFERLARQHPAVKKYRSKETECAQRRALLFRLRGHSDAAEPFMRRAVALQRQIVQDFPELAEQHLLSRNLGNLGHLLHNMNRQQEARTSLEEAIQINRGVARAAPRNPRYRVTTAWLQQELFWNLRDLGDPTAADRALRKAVELRRQLVADFPGVPSHRGYLVSDLRMLVERLADTGKGHEAVPLGRESVRVGEKLVADYPREPAFRQHLAEACYSWARALHRAREVVEGEKARRRSIVLYKALCAEFPGVPMYWEGLGTGHSGLAFVLMQTDRLPEAKEETFRALAVFEKLAKDYPSMADYPFRVAETSVNLAGTLAVLGEPNRDVIRKGLAALEPLLRQGKNARYEKIHDDLKKQPSFAAPHPPGKTIFHAREVASAPTSLRGKLTRDDPLDTFPLTRKSHHRVHLLVLPGGKSYQVDLTGDFDTFLRLEDAARNLLLYNDDVSSPDNRNSRVVFESPINSVYRFVVTSLKPGATGPYTLKVREAVPAGPPQVIEGKLTDQSKNINGKYVERHKVELQADLAYVIVCQSPEFDTQMVLGNATGQQVLAQAMMLNGKRQSSRIDYTPGQTGPYQIFLSSTQPGRTGAYTVRIQGYKLAAP
jgi:serine/threonine-protein kinase